MADTNPPGYTERRPDIRRMFKQSRTPMPNELRVEVREVAARMFGLGPETSGPCAPGDHLGPYRVNRVLGVGGQAYVYEAEHTQLGRKVALKVPKPDVSERLLKEARISARLDHPRIVRVEHVGEHEGLSGSVPYLVMEYLEGGSLDHLLEQHQGGMPIEMVKRIGTDVLEALAFAHSQGVVHRDVKPSNVLFDRDGKLKLADLGIGKVAMGPDLDHSIEHTELTAEGVAVGTPLFMAPEQEDPALLAGETIDGRADLFSFGKMLFLMLTGANPRTIRPASRLREGLDPAWDDLIFKLVEEDRDKRFDNAEDVVLALGGMVDPERPVIQITRDELGSGEHPEIKVTEKGTVPVGIPVFPEQAPLGFLVPPGAERARWLFGVLAVASLGLFAFLGWQGASHGFKHFAWLMGGSGLASFFLWRFRKGEQRASKSIGTFGALVVSALVAGWQPFLYLGRYEIHGYELSHMSLREFNGLGAGLTIATVLLGMFIAFLYRRRRRPPPPEERRVRAVPKPPTGVVGLLTGFLKLATSLVVGAVASLVALVAGVVTIVWLLVT